MPAIAVAAVGAAMSGAMAAASGAVIMGLTGTMLGVAVGALSFAMSVVMQLIAPTPGKGGIQGAVATPLANQDRQANVRQPIMHWQYMYGQARVGGAITFQHTTNNNKTLHYVLTIAGHSVSEIGTLYLNEHIVPLDADGNAIAPTDPDPSIPNWEGKLRVWKGLGTDAGDSDLLAAITENAADKWTDEHKQRGRAKIYLKFEYDSNLFAGGFPKITVVVRGKKVYDPRGTSVSISSSSVGSPGLFATSSAHGLAIGDDVYIANHSDAIGGRDIGPIDGSYIVDTVPTASTFTLRDASYAVTITTAGTGGTVSKMAWSANPILCTRDYMSDKYVGPSILSTEIDDAGSGIAGANICEQYVQLAGNSETFTANETTDVITLSNAVSWPTGAQVYITTTGTLPSGLSAGTPYYVINQNAGGTGSTVSFKLSDTLRDAVGQDVVPLGSAGSGTLSIIKGSAFTADSATSILTTAYTSIDTPIGGADKTYTTSSFPFRTGDKVKLSSTGMLPTGLSSVTTYFWISNDTQNGLIAATLADAIARIPVTFSDAGTGTHIIYVTHEQRYTCNGVLDTTKVPSSIIQDLMSSMSGKVAWTGGQFVMLPGYYRTPSVTIDENDVIGPIQVQSRISRRDLYNRVKGTFIDPTSSWQPNDFPAVISSSYTQEDQGVPLWANFDLGFTDSPSTAQRLAAIAMESVRRQMTVTMSCKLTLLETRVGDVVMVNNTRFGWSNKTFEIVDWTFASIMVDGGGDTQVPYLGINLMLRETDANVYAWSSSQQAITLPAPRTNLPVPFSVVSPDGLGLTEELYVTRDGAGVKSKAILSWSNLTAAYIAYTTVRYRIEGSGDAGWIETSPSISSPVEILDIAPGVYEWQAKNFNNVGASSNWSSTLRKEVFGLGAKPSAIQGLTISAISSMALMRWVQSTDLDVRIGGTVVFRHSPAASGATWSESTSIGTAIPGSDTVAVLPLLSGTYLARFVDSTGNMSDVSMVTTDGATVLAFSTVDTVTESPTFPGTKTDVFVSGGNLQLSGSSTIDDISDFDAMPSVDLSGGVSLTGEYLFASGIDLGSVQRTRLVKSITASIVNTIDLFDDRAENIDDWANFDGTGSANADAIVYVRSTQTDPLGSPVWSEWQRLDVAEFSARAFQFKCELSTDDPAYNIYVSSLSVRAEQL